MSSLSQLCPDSDMSSVPITSTPKGPQTGCLGLEKGCGPMHTWGVQTAPMRKAQEGRSLSPGRFIAAAPPAPASGSRDSAAEGISLTTQAPQAPTLHPPPGLNRDQQHRQGNASAGLEGIGQVGNQPPIHASPSPLSPPLTTPACPASLTSSAARSYVVTPA